MADDTQSWQDVIDAAIAAMESGEGLDQGDGDGVLSRTILVDIGGETYEADIHGGAGGRCEGGCTGDAVLEGCFGCAEIVSSSLAKILVYLEHSTGKEIVVYVAKFGRPAHELVFGIEGSDGTFRLPVELRLIGERYVQFLIAGTVERAVVEWG